jgi:UDP-glucose 4-epimerase
MNKGYILITGGAGYIGSHVTLLLLEQGYNVVVFDNLCNSYKSRIDVLRTLSGKTFPFVQASVEDRDAMMEVFKAFRITAVMHFAGLKSVSESLENPLTYYMNNVNATCILLECMKAHDCERIIFSSSATVYGDVSTDAFIVEDSPTSPTTPYGRSKLMCEEIIQDVVKANGLNAGIHSHLSYFSYIALFQSSWKSREWTLGGNATKSTQ